MITDQDHWSGLDVLQHQIGNQLTQMERETWHLLVLAVLNLTLESPVNDSTPAWWKVFSSKRSSFALGSSAKDYIFVFDNCVTLGSPAPVSIWGSRRWRVSSLTWDTEESSRQVGLHCFLSMKCHSRSFRECPGQDSIGHSVTDTFSP